MYYFKLNKNQIKKLIEAHKNDTNATFQIDSNKIFKGENIYYLDKIQLDKLKNAKEKKSGVRLEIRSSQIKDKKGGFLPLIFAGIGAASALVGGVTSIVNTVNDYKHKKAMEKETIRHNKEMENKDKMILAKELHKPVRKKFPTRRIFTKGIDDLWAADLVIMRNYSDENKGYSYIITVIDTFSKFSWALELKKKDGINVSEAFEKIIKQAISQNHQAPKLLHADKGLEFENKHFKKVLQKYGIKMYHTQNEEKLSIIERFNRTLNSKMRLHFEVTNSKKWIKILKSLIYEYNFKDIHRSIGMRPCEVNKSNEDVVFHKLFSTKNKPKLKIKFSVGDRNVKYNLNKIPIEGNILIISQGDVDFGNGKPYVSKLLHSPTWLELCKIANEQIIATDNPVIGQLKHVLKKKNLKVNIMFLAIYKRGTNEENMEYKECNFKTTNKILTTNSDLNVYYTNEKIKIVNEIEEFVMKNSQWRLHQILSLGININKYVPFKGSSYIPLPKHIGDKKAIINVQNKDDKCFLWAILSALHPAKKDTQRVTKYIPFENEFDNE
ncbi:hypothetical protein QTP88_028951 [Uroleucon formosanum]